MTSREHPTATNTTTDTFMEAATWNDPDVETMVEDTTVNGSRLQEEPTDTYPTSAVAATTTPSDDRSSLQEAGPNPAENTVGEATDVPATNTSHSMLTVPPAATGLPTASTGTAATAATSTTQADRTRKRRAADEARRRKRRAHQQAQADVQTEYREAIARGYQLYSGAKLLEQHAFSTDIAKHSTAQSFVLQAMETMRDEAEEVWSALSDCTPALGYWEHELLQLCHFLLEHGHMDVPKSDDVEEQKLNEFIASCRGLKSLSERRAAVQEHVQALRCHRVEVLDMIGFKWASPNHICALKPWDDYFDDLVAYKAKYGNCLVPNVKALPEELRPTLLNLSKWVVMQRRRYVRRQQQDPSQPPPRNMMSEDQMNRLNSIGFVWNASKTNFSYDDYFAMLVEFRNREGHCKVPQIYPDNPSLGLWVQRMRRSYRDKYTKGIPVKTLTDEREAQLEALGFLWTTRTKQRTPAPTGMVAAMERALGPEQPPTDTTAAVYHHHPHHYPHQQQHHQW